MGIEPEIIKSIRSEDEIADGYDGFEIKTNKRTIQLLVDNFQGCCESWGYMCSEDNPQDFVGSELLCIEYLNMDRRKVKVDCGDLDAGRVMFIDLVTTQGTFQVAVYNAHNGFYGHDARFVIDNELVTSMGI